MHTLAAFLIILSSKLLLSLFVKLYGFQILNLNLKYFALCCHNYLIAYSNFIQYVALVDSVRADVSVLTLLAEVLCLLDMIVNSFAHTISTKPVDRYTRPKFTG